jgi:hypothetical protein
MLFCAHVGPAMSEALYNDESCYLAQPEWMKLYESFAVDTPPWLMERSHLTIRIRKQMLYLPGMIKDVTRAIDVALPYDGGLLFVLELQLRKIHQGMRFLITGVPLISLTMLSDLLDALEDYKSHVVRTSMLAPPETELSLRRELFGSALECLCFHKRMLATLCDPDRPKLESEVQALALLLVEMAPSGRHSWLYRRVEQGVVSIMQVTRSAWEEDTTGLSVSGKRAASHKRWKAFRVYLDAHG